MLARFCFFDLSRPVGRGHPGTVVGWRGAAEGGFVPHLAPRSLTCCFVVMIFAGSVFGLVSVEEGGVQWGAVE
jgi:hypothetical protein